MTERLPPDPDEPVTDFLTGHGRPRPPADSNGDDGQSARVGAENLPTLEDRWGDQSNSAGLLGRALAKEKPTLRLDDAGMGKWVDRTLGGGVQPGNMAGLVSAGAGTGKTAWVHQAADGFAKWSAANLAGHAGSNGPRPVVAPVLYVTEMQALDMTLRTLARESERPGALLRAPNSYVGSQYGGGQGGLTVGDEALARAGEAALKFRPAARFVVPVDRTVRTGKGTEAVAFIGAAARHLRARWENSGAHVVAVVVVVDPLHRITQGGEDETGALGETLDALLTITHTQGLVTIFTSDTTKEAVKLREPSGDVKGGGGFSLEQQAELAFRGSYQLLHVPDFAYALRALDPDKVNAKGEKVQADLIPLASYFKPDSSDPKPNATWETVYADLISPKLRWGKVGELPAYRYDRALFRFRPMQRPEPPR